jgi:hypothetical protein
MEMRPIIAVALLLAACSQQPAEPSIKSGTFAGQGRDRLCIAGEGGGLRAGLIAYGEGDLNCSASGSLQPAGEGWELVPKGEGDCRIPVEVDGNKVRIGQPPASCAYYCGPTATMAGKSFDRSDMGSTAVDLAGDPLC